MELDEDSETSTHGLQNRCSAAELIQLIEYSHFLTLVFSIKHSLHALANSPHPTYPTSSAMFDCLNGLDTHHSVRAFVTLRHERSRFVRFNVRLQTS